MRKVLRGYAKDRSGNLILIGTIAVPNSKDRPSPRERQDKAHLVARQLDDELETNSGSLHIIVRSCKSVQEVRYSGQLAERPKI